MAMQRFDYRNKVRTEIKAGARRNLKAAAILLQNHAKELVSVDGTTQVPATSKKTGRKLKRTNLAYNTNPSKPGEPPHVQTGRLRASISHEVTGVTARVGTNLEYGRYLELGTRKMAARPWLRRSLTEAWTQLQRILSTPIPK